jgi:hypothetical protein
LKIRTSIPAIVQTIDCDLRFGFPFVARIHVANQMIAYIVTYLTRAGSVAYKENERTSTHMQFEKVSKLGKFTVQIFVNGVKTFLELLLCELANGIMCGVVIYIR